MISLWCIDEGRKDLGFEESNFGARLEGTPGRQTTGRHRDGSGSGQRQGNRITASPRGTRRRGTVAWEGWDSLSPRRNSGCRRRERTTSGRAEATATARGTRLSRPDFETPISQGHLVPRRGQRTVFILSRRLAWKEGRWARQIYWQTADV